MKADQRYKLKKEDTRRIKFMHLFFMCVVLFFLFYIIFGIIFNSTIEQDAATLRESMIHYKQTVLAHRGSIYARNGEPLASSITRTSLDINFGNERFDDLELFRKNADTLSKKLADYFGDKSAKEYYNQLLSWRDQSVKMTPKVVERKRPRFRFLKWLFYDVEIDTVQEVKRRYLSRQLFRSVDLNEWEDIRQFPILRNGHNSTYVTRSEDHRIYPYENLARRTIGQMRDTVRGRDGYGIERAMEDTLRGTNGVQVMQVIAPDVYTRVNSDKNVEARDGYDVVTTLDLDLQDMASEALRKQLIEQNAFWGTTIVMEVATGDILAMVNLERKGKRCVESQNFAMDMPINPGSTFKLVSAMALLEEGFPTKTKIDSELGEKVEIAAKAVVGDSHPIGRETGGVITMHKAFAESANVYFTRAVYNTFKSNPQKFSDFITNLYFGKPLGLKDFHTAVRVVRSLDSSNPSPHNSLVNYGYGYGLDVTPLHTITVYNAVANNGRMVAPRFILRTERDGKVVNRAPVEVLHERICSASTIDTLRMLLEEVSVEGTASKYFGKGKVAFSSGSKTGTAQVNTIINGVRYRKEDKCYYGSMVTYIPADKPRYTIMTAVFNKEQKGKAFYGADIAGPVQQSVANYLYNRDYRDVKPFDKRQYAASVEATAKVDLAGVGEDVSCVPNVVGMGLSDALYLLESRGLTVKVSGYGTVVEQSLAAGAEIDDKTRKIEIKLK